MSAPSSTAPPTTEGAPRIDHPGRVDAPDAGPDGCRDPETGELHEDFFIVTEDAQGTTDHHVMPCRWDPVAATTVPSASAVVSTPPPPVQRLPETGGGGTVALAAAMMVAAGVAAIRAARRPAAS